MVTTCIKVKNCTTWKQVPISCIIKYKGAKHACYVRNQVITIQHEIFLNWLWLVHPCVPISCNLNAPLTTHLYYFLLNKKVPFIFLISIYLLVTISKFHACALYFLISTTLFHAIYGINLGWCHALGLPDLIVKLIRLGDEWRHSS